MNGLRGFQVITASLAILFVLCLTGLIVLYQSNNSLAQRLDRERLKSEALLSEKLIIQKGFEKCRETDRRSQRETFDLRDKLATQSEMIALQTAKNKKLEAALLRAEQQYQRQVVLNKKLKAIRFLVTYNKHDDPGNGMSTWTERTGFFTDIPIGGKFMYSTKQIPFRDFDHIDKPDTADTIK
jgi:hypothetical protein